MLAAALRRVAAPSVCFAAARILLVEQNAQMALSVADRAYVLETGRVVMDGTGAELLTNERVRSAYLGG